MKRCLLIFTLFHCLIALTGVLALQAQNRQTVGDHDQLYVSGHIYGTDDMEPNPYPLPNANVTWVCLNDTLAGRASCASNKEGLFSKSLDVLKKRIKKNESARIRLHVSYVGYETFEKEYTMSQHFFDPQSKSSGYYWLLNLDNIVLKSKPMSTEEVQIVAELKRMYESGDTTVFNVDAFMMPRGTVLLNLVRRLPGLRYDQGVLTYRDSVIHEIRLNGESFFASDMRIALENIENEDLKQFRIYHDIDTIRRDSSRLVADMVTKKPVNRVEIAKPEAGTSDKKNTYLLKMENVHWNSGKRGEWATTMTLSDLPSASSWKNSNNSINGSYSRTIKKVNVNGSASYNYSDNRGKNEVLSATVMPEYQQYSRSISQNKTYNNSYNQSMYASRRIGNRGSLSAQMNLSYGTNHSNDWTESATYNANPFTADGQELLSEPELRAIGLTNITNARQQRRHNDNMSFSSSYSTSFKGKNSPSINFNMRYSHGHSFSTNYEKRETAYLQYGDSIWNYERFSTSPNDNDQFSFYANFYMYHSTQDSPFRSNIQLSYNYTNNKSVGGTDVYDVASGMAFIDSLSSCNRNTTIQHAMGAHYSLSYKELTIDLNMGVTPTQSGYRNELMDGFVADTTVNGIQFNPAVSIRYGYGQNKYVSLGYSASNSLPSPSSLVTSSTKYNPLNIRKPNPDLKQAVSHRITLNWNATRSFNMNANVNLTRNSTTQRSIYNTTTGGTITMPVNINGAWTAYGSMTYRTDFKHANFSISGNYNYNHGVSYQRTSQSADDIEGYSDYHNITLSPRFVVYGKKYDLTLNGSYGYQWNKTNYTTERDRIHSYSLNSRFNIWPNDRLTLTTDMNLTGHAGYRMADANRTDIIWNMHVQYKFPPHYRTTAKLSWYDILCNRRNYTSTISGTSWSERRYSGTSQYVLLTIQYKLYKLK